MPSGAVLPAILGPLLDIGPRVAEVMASGLLALAAVRTSKRAFCERRGFASLGFYGSAAMLRGAPDPLSGAGI
jgi:hypothetical protein